MTKTLAQLTPSECEALIQAAYDEQSVKVEVIDLKWISHTEALFMVCKIDNSYIASALTIYNDGRVRPDDNERTINAPRLVQKMAELGVKWPVN